MPKKIKKEKSPLEQYEQLYNEQEYQTFQQEYNEFTRSSSENIVTTTTNQVFDKICASIIGLAWGDILGSPVEGYRWFHIRNIYAVEEELPPVPQDLFGIVYDCDYHTKLVKPYYRELPHSMPLSSIKKYGGMKFIRKCRPIGFWSDDTQQALALVNCLCIDPDASESVFLDAWRQWIVRGWQTKAWRGVGGNFTNASKKLADSKNSIYECGSDSMGIGSAMKIGPIGALLRDASIQQLSQAVYNATFVTHASLAGASTSFAVAYIVHQFINGKSAQEIRESLVTVIKQYETEYGSDNDLKWNISHRDVQKHAVSETLEKILLFMNESTETDAGIFLSELRDTISESARIYLTAISDIDEKSKKIQAYHVNQGAVLLGGIHAITVSLISHIDISPNDILLSICQLGYDTDTVAAIAGTMLGARYGMKFLEPFLDKIYNAQLLLQYATHVNSFILNDPSTHTQLESKEQYMKRESIMTAFEKAYQKHLKQSQIE
jgi:ADP-ribosyl-[dinitrogen reductase] hydrolase